jgi:hypothetical protein
MINTLVPNNDNVLTNKHGYISVGATDSAQSSSMKIVVLAFIDHGTIITRGIRSV